MARDTNCAVSRYATLCSCLLAYFIAYRGVQDWWKTRKHWHTEEFGRVVDAIIAKGTESKAYSTYNLREIAAPGHAHE